MFELHDLAATAGGMFLGSFLAYLTFKWKIDDLKKQISDLRLEHETAIKDAKEIADKAIRETKESMVKAIQDAKELADKAFTEMKSTLTHMSKDVVWKDACEVCTGAARDRRAVTDERLGRIESDIKEVGRKVDMILIRCMAGAATKVPVSRE